MTPLNPRDFLAVDGAGNVVAFGPEDIQERTRGLINTGEVLAVILRDPASRDVSIHVIGPPSPEVLALLEDTVAAYRRVLGITASEAAPSITCPECRHISYNPHDIAERYCGHCHKMIGGVV